jgi:hypothetical protein
MISNIFNRAAIERAKQWARWLSNEAPTPTSTPVSPDGQQPAGEEEPVMNPIEKVDGVISTMNEIKSDISNYVAEEKAISYREGVEAGKAMIELPDSSNPDVIYTQAQMNAAVNSGQTQQRLADEAEFKVALDGLQAQIDGVPAQIAKAVDEARTEERRKFREALATQQAAESASEKALEETLADTVVETPVSEGSASGEVSQ